MECIIILLVISFLLQFKGSTPSACWDKIYKRIRKMQVSTPDGLRSVDGSRKKSGSDMFGFSHPEVLKLIQVNISQLYTDYFEVVSFFFVCPFLLHISLCFSNILYFSSLKWVSTVLTGVIELETCLKTI